MLPVSLVVEVLVVPCAGRRPPGVIPGEDWVALVQGRCGSSRGVERPAEDGLAAHVSSFLFPVCPQAFDMADIQMTQKWNLQIWSVSRSLP